MSFKKHTFVVTIAYCLVVMLQTMLFTSCNDDWTDEQYDHYVSFKSPLNADGVTNIYVRYKDDGTVTYKLPLIKSGSTVDNNACDVHVTEDSDTLNTLNLERFSNRTELYYKLLPKNYYSFDEVVHFPENVRTTTMDLNFNLSGIDMKEKWVLPLTVVDSNKFEYVGNPRKNYKKAILRVIPFNDYSGNYSTSTMEVYFRDAQSGDADAKPMTANSRTAYVVDENTVFFYAGLESEDLEERAVYKIFVKFNEEDKTLSLWAADPRINFSLIGTPAYSVTQVNDAVRPYLVHKYVSFNLEYNFDDITSVQGAKIPYKVKGTMTLERNLNTEVPDEDQAIEW